MTWFLPDSIRILYIDDSPADRDLVRHALLADHGNFQLTEAGSKEEFENLFPRQRFDVVLTDFHILGYEGTQVLEAVKAHSPHTPVIFVTGTGSEEIAVAAMLRGAADYVIKTAKHIRRLPQTIYRVLESACEQKENVLLKMAVDASTDCIAITSADHKVIYVNEAASQFLGRAARDITGKSTAELLDRDTLAKVDRRILPEAKRLDRWQGEIELLGRDGTPTHFSAVVQIHNVDADRHAYTSVIARDISAQKQIERERDWTLHVLRERVKELTTLQAISRLLHEHTGTNAQAMSAVVSLLPSGWQHTEVAAARISFQDETYCSDHFRPDAPHRQTCCFGSETLGTGEIEIVYLKTCPAEAEDAFLNEERQLLEAIAALLGSYLERRDTAARLREERQRYEDLIHNIPDVTWTALEDGTPSFISPNATNILGFSASEILQGKVQLWPDRVHPQDRERLKHAFSDMFETGKPFDLEFRLRHRDGHWLWIHNRALRSIETESGDRCAYGVATDVTSRRSADQLLVLQERALGASVNGVLICRAGPGYPIEYVNPAFERITGYDRPEVVGRNPHFLYGTDNDQPGLDRVRSALRKQEDVRALLRNYRKDGSEFWNDLTVAPVHNSSGKVTHYIGVQNEVTEVINYQHQLEYQATHDQLTGLANRSVIQDRLSQAIEQARRNDSKISVIFLDLDNFKVHNDTRGHSAGDRILEVVGQRLNSIVRRGDTLARMGGDEFVLILQHQTEQNAALYHVLNRINDTLEEPIDLERHQVKLTCSMGVSVFPGDGDEADSLLKHADIAMYRAKESGKNQFQFFTEDMNAAVVQRSQIERGLREALKNDELKVHYQAQASLDTGLITGFEALLRWESDAFDKPVPPDQFISIAEETGLIIPMGEWVIRQACRAARGWRDAGFADPVISVNLSAHQLYHGRLVELVESVLRDTELPAGSLELELTESVLMRDQETALGTLSRLRDLGVRLAIDDFGTGYSSLAYLKRMPVNRLKIDKSFTSDVTTNAEDAIIARSIVTLGHSLGMRVIAEGVETQEQVNFMRTHYCDEVQGYLLSRPVALETAMELLREGRKLDLLGGDEDANETRTVLLVDDEPNILRSLTRLLRRDGYRILTAPNPQEALTTLAHHEVGVIISDQRMPGMRGVDFLSRVKELYPNTVRIMLSGYTELNSVTDAVNRGDVYKFVTKPWDDDALRANVKEAFARFEMEHENRLIMQDIRKNKRR